MVIHVVQPGDSLYRIAQMHGVPLPFLIQQNELHEPYRLTPGQTIVVPQPTQTYTVRRGDTLGDIAARNGTTVLALWQNNPQLGGTDRIYPGQSLVLSYGPKLGTFAVNGYAYPNIDLRVLRKTLPYLTYLSVFSYGFDRMGRILPQNADLLTRMARQYGVRPLLVLTTLGEDGQFSGERAHRLFQDTAARGALARRAEQVRVAQGRKVCLRKGESAAEPEGDDRHLPRGQGLCPLRKGHGQVALAQGVAQALAARAPTRAQRNRRPLLPVGVQLLHEQRVLPLEVRDLPRLDVADRRQAQVAQAHLHVPEHGAVPLL